MSNETSRAQYLSHVKDSLNEKQFDAFAMCVNSTDNVFCTGSAGTGKSRVLKYVIEYFSRFKPPNTPGGLNVAVTASTGIAAFLVKGITLHRFAGVGIEEDDLECMYSLAGKGSSALYWRDTDILIIDEISMVSPVFFENISKVGSYIRDDPAPFGGLKLIVCGDFLQLPPVSRKSSEDRVFSTSAWKLLEFHPVTLTEIMRQDEGELMDVLSSIRYGTCGSYAMSYIENLRREPEWPKGTEPTTLFATRKNVALHNKERLDMLDSKVITFKSIDEGKPGTLSQCPAQAVLDLKVGAQVMLIRNLSSSAVNGSVGTIVRFDNRYDDLGLKPVVQFLDHNDNEFEVSLNRVTWETITPDRKIESSRTQFPIILAWALTIHKSQGQTIDRLRVDLDGIFEVGQTYVALSRAHKSSRLQVTNFNPSRVKASASCRNFHRELKDDVDPRAVDRLIDTIDQYAARAARQTLDLQALSSTKPWDKTNPDSAEAEPTGQDEAMIELEEEMLGLMTK